jgi:hypothetical protein
MAYHTRFFLSLEDNLFRIFGGDKIKVSPGHQSCIRAKGSRAPLEPKRACKNSKNCLKALTVRPAWFPFPPVVKMFAPKKLASRAATAATVIDDREQAIWPSGMKRGRDVHGGSAQSSLLQS